MLHLGRILVPVDFSPPCATVARHAAGMAKRFHSEVHLLHVVGSAALSGEEEGTAARALDRFVPAELQEAPVTKAVRSGDPATEIVRYAREMNCSLIAIPTRGQGVLRQLLLGSVTAKVLHDAECPVWTGVHSECFAAAAVPEISSVVCAVDFSPSGTKALRWARQFAAVHSARLTLVHVLPAVHPSWRPSFEAPARNSFASLLDTEALQAETRIEYGEVGESVSAVARAAGAQLVVVGRGDASAALGRLRSSTYSTIRQSPCPVVSV
jgi:nucleotide-binding universal stress UspA family protein